MFGLCSVFVVFKGRGSEAHRQKPNICLIMNCNCRKTMFGFSFKSHKCVAASEHALLRHVIDIKQKDHIDNTYSYSYIRSSILSGKEIQDPLAER